MRRGIAWAVLFGTVVVTLAFGPALFTLFGCGQSPTEPAVLAPRLEQHPPGTFPQEPPTTLKHLAQFDCDSLFKAGAVYVHGREGVAFIKPGETTFTTPRLPRGYYVIKIRKVIKGCIYGPAAICTVFIKGPPEAKREPKEQGAF